MSLGAEQAHTGFIKHEVMRKRFYRGPGSLKRKEVEDHRQSRLLHMCVLSGQVSLSSAMWRGPWRRIPSPPPSQLLFLKHESEAYWGIPSTYLSTLSRHTEWPCMAGKYQQGENSRNGVDSLRKKGKIEMLVGLYMMCEEMKSRIPWCDIVIYKKHIYSSSYFWHRAPKTPKIS